MTTKPAKSTSMINFFRSLDNLRRSATTPITEPRDLSGILKDFEMAYELSWKSLKKHLQAQGHETLGAKDVYTKAFQLGYLKDQMGWLEMIQDRNQTAHVYDAAEAEKICVRVKARYLPLFEELKLVLERV